MPFLAAPIPELTENQRKELEAIVRKRTSPQRLVERARIILLAGKGYGVVPTVRELKLQANTVRKWRTRWTEREGLSTIERLSDAPRPGAPARITPEQICQIIAMACEPPEKYGRSITHWTQHELADESVKQGIIEYISQRSVGRFLKSRGY